MSIPFAKYQGTGNDFVMIDNRNKVFNRHDTGLVQKMCKPKFGVGADGLILIENHDKYDFEMVYFNSDGSQSLCGNGSRCAVNYAKELGVINEATEFLAIDGPHKAVAYSNGNVSLQMSNQHEWQLDSNEGYLHNGSPHLVLFTDNIHEVDVKTIGAQYRYSNRFKPGGTNVNFVQYLGENRICVRTYERGVEDETLSCGTGVTASALLTALKFGLYGAVSINTKGGDLMVKFSRHPDHFSDILLEGPALKVYEGKWDV